MPSPPPFDNFGGKHVVVYHDPYQYGVKSYTGEYLMQNSPEFSGAPGVPVRPTGDTPVPPPAEART